MERYNLSQIVTSAAPRGVFLRRDNLTNSNVAVKWIPFDDKSHGLPCLVLREIAVLKELKHVNVVRLLDVVDQEDGINLVFERMHMDLARFIDHTEADVSHQIKEILFQILEGVSYCHSQKVIHRDLKPRNLLLDLGRKTVKLADFGLARTTDVPLEYSTNVVTIAYRAPELLLGAPYSSAVDIWSVGCIFAEMVRRRPLFHGVTDTAVMKDIIRIFGFPENREWRGVEADINNFFGGPTASFPTEASKDLASVVPGLEPEGLDLLTKMLCIYPNKRITAYDALQHPYLRGLRTVGTEQVQSTVSTRRKNDCCTVI